MPPETKKKDAKAGTPAESKKDSKAPASKAGEKKQGELPGVKTKLTKAQKAAEELVDAVIAAASSKELVESRTDRLVTVMKETNEKSTSVLDSEGIKHTYHLERIDKLKHKKN